VNVTDDNLSPRTRAVGAAFKATVAVGLLLILVGMIRSDLRAQEQRDDIERVLGVLVECTTDPAERKQATAKVGEDDCFVRAQNRTADAIGQIGDLSVVAAACGAANPGNVPGTRKCVEEALDR
jgi:hypothetical protein